MLKVRFRTHAGIFKQLLSNKNLLDVAVLEAVDDQIKTYVIRS